MQVMGGRDPRSDTGPRFSASDERLAGASAARISELLEVVKDVIPSQSWDCAVPLAKRPGKADIFVVGNQRHPRRIVAKLQERRISLLEASVYQNVLNPLGIPSVACHGVQPSSVDPGAAWLLIGFAEGARFNPRSHEHANALAEWIAALHTGAPQISQAGSFPDHGEDYWQIVLATAVKTLQAGIGNEVLTANEVSPLKTMELLLEAVLEQWSDMIALMRRLPPTLTHGDLVPNNVMVRTGFSGSRPLVLDWGEVGWGSPVIDLLLVEPASYLDAIGSSLKKPGREPLELADLARMRALGLVLWTAFVINGDETNLSSAWPQRAAANVSWYIDVLLSGAVDRLVGWAR